MIYLFICSHNINAHVFESIKAIFHMHMHTHTYTSTHTHTQAHTHIHKHTHTHTHIHFDSKDQSTGRDVTDPTIRIGCHCY